MSQLILGFLPLALGLFFVGAVMAKHNAWGVIAFYTVLALVLVFVTFRLV